MIACHECASGNVAVAYDDPALRDDGAFEVECLECHASLYVPASATARTRIAALREIARDHRVSRLDGYIVDPTTAALLCQLYDALAPKSRETFGNVPILRLVTFAWERARTGR